MHNAHLFSPLKIRGLTLKNRIAVSPMCQYSSVDGFASDWHLVHLGSRAVGGAALVLTEAAAVTPEGRISPQDLGIWSDEHIPMLKRITDFIKSHEALAGIQLAHAGRKASTKRPWDDGPYTVPEKAGGWLPVAPSAIAFSDDSATPHALTLAEIKAIPATFVAASIRALKAGFQVIEIHSAHGYLLHEFLSPISNQRSDEYGGALENRARLLLEVAQAVRQEVGDQVPLFVRISATDWVPHGWTADDSVKLSQLLIAKGVDLIDVSSGGTVLKAEIPAGPGYQTPFAERIKKESTILTGTVGMITSPAQADHIIRNGQADMVLLAREMLRDPYWPLKAGRVLGHRQPWPVQYSRAEPIMD
jgi:2,4-dienoyl-CoA reductase-like NADH-dependent reductase (Old Yellow Enzyme family)